MTLLNTAANLGGTWPSSFILYLLGQWTFVTQKNHAPRTDAYFPMQMILCVLGLVWLWRMGNLVTHVEHLPSEAWNTRVIEKDEEKDETVQRINSKNR
jgi:PAT family acetyl-CoA transporter-like MFS transporter 1